jgi:hypothetical protein
MEPPMNAVNGIGRKHMVHPIRIAIGLGLVIAPAEVAMAQAAQDPPFKLPENVEMRTGIVYGKGGGRDLKLDLFLPRQERATVRRSFSSTAAAGRAAAGRSSTDRRRIWRPRRATSAHASSTASRERRRSPPR